MFVKKIPRRFLIHTVTMAEVETAAGAFGGNSVKEKERIENVRMITLQHQVKITRDNEDYEATAMLIHQPGISTACEFTAGGHILFEGQLYEIIAVDKMYEAERLHHTEVKLKL